MRLTGAITLKAKHLALVFFYAAVLLCKAMHLALLSIGQEMIGIQIATDPLRVYCWFQTLQSFL